MAKSKRNISSRKLRKRHKKYSNKKVSTNSSPIDLDFYTFGHLKCRL